MTRFDLQGKVAVVTGGNKGLGLAMAKGMAEAGADLFLIARNRDDLVASQEQLIESTGRRVEIAVADMAVRQQVVEVGKQAITTMGQVDILINNAGMNHPQEIDQIQDDVWDKVLEVNLTSIMILTRTLVPDMKTRRWGRIIHISSMFGLISKAKRNAYSSTKAALIGLTKASALDLGPFNITVNCICPGPFLTDMPKSLLSDHEKAEFAQRTALNRWGEPQELVGPALLLASEAGSYITGHALLVDGGYTAR